MPRERPATRSFSSFTPYDDEYGTCERALASLWIHGLDLDPAEVTRLLGLAPTEWQKRGQVFRPNSLGRNRTARNGAWILSSEGTVVSRDLRRHLDWLLAQIRPHLDGLQTLQSTAGISVTVNCIWESKYGHGGPVLWPEQMRELADLNVEIGIDVSYPSDSDPMTLAEFAAELSTPLRERRSRGIRH